MGNRVETVKNHLGSLANRIIGRSAWMEAIQKPNESYSYSYTAGQPTWARAINRTLYQGAPLEATLQTLFPLTYRAFHKMIDHPGEKPNAEAVIFFSSVVTDFALMSPAIFLSNSIHEAVGFKLGANAVSQIGIDLAGAAINKIKNFRPHSSTLAV